MPLPPRRNSSSVGFIAATLFLGSAVCASAFGLSANPPGGATPKTPSPQQITFFETRIRPVLVEQCVPCHGPTRQESSVRLDNAADALKALTKGDPEKSRLIHVLRYDGDIQMPPAGKRPASEIADMTEWVKMGAPWPADAPKPRTTAAAVGAVPVAETPAWKARARWWAFQPVRRNIAPPKVKNAAWASGPVDRFLLSSLESRGLTPAPAADKRTLLRRAYFDLLGLPPTPEQVDAFLKDRSPDAFAKVVDALLASPHFGERWGRHWLDVARYADSNGLDENKAFGYAWRYRDWVVNALNRDEPYDEFLRDQIAGDLLDSGADVTRRNERLTATGFLSLGAKVLSEQDKPKLVMDIVDEQIDVTCKATMGLTVTCARCHDHKFDPITTKDYYALAGIFKSTRTMANLGFVSQVNERSLPTAALLAERDARIEAVKPLEAAVKSARENANAALSDRLRADSDRYLAAVWELSRRPGLLLSRAEARWEPGDALRVFQDARDVKHGNSVLDTDHYGKGIEGGVITSNKVPNSAVWEVKLPAPAGHYQLEFRYASKDSRPVRLRINNINVKRYTAAAVTGSSFLDGQQWEAQGAYVMLAGVNTIEVWRDDGPLPQISRILLTPVPDVAAGYDAKATAQAADEFAKKSGLIGSVVARWASRIVEARDLTDARKRVVGDNSLFAPPKNAEMYYSGLTGDAFRSAAAARDAAQEAIPEIPMVLAVADQETAEDVRVHIRGSTENLGDVVTRGMPAILARGGDLPTPAGEAGSGRLALARWLIDPRHPLTSRVAVNRTWQHLFGEGLVRTPDNWGLRGETPTNPDLLDYLAATFVQEDHWSQKKLIRRLMLSSAYRMSCAASPAMTAKCELIDPENRLLWHMNRRRLEAEPFRDAVLAVAGKLDMTMGGTLLATPDGEYVTNDQSKDQAVYASPRRSLYLPVIRNSLFDLYQAFDYGDAMTVNAHRSTTTVAPQGLYVLNSPLVRDASEAFANDLLATPTGDDTARVKAAYLRAFDRPAQPADIRRAEAFLTRYDAAAAPTEPDPIKRRARSWQSLCQALFASNEFIYVN